MIDYENVHGDGLEGCQDLGNTDHIVIFFTQNAKSLDMSVISNHGSAHLDMREGPAGKQSADIHIGSYLGYLAGKNGKDCKVVIVSKDTDFDNVVKFWKKETGMAAIRQEQIKKKRTSKQQQKEQSTPKQQQKKQPEPKLQQKKQATPKQQKKQPPVVTDKATIKVRKSGTTVSSEDKTAINSEIQRILSKAGFSNDIISFVASTVVKNLRQNNGKQQIYRAIISQYGQNKGLAIYNQIKRHI